MGDAVESKGESRGSWLEQIERQLSSPVIPTIVAVIVFTALQAHRYNYPDPDATFHIAVAKTYLTNGWLSNFRWMHSTWLAEHFVDPYWLTHWLTVPFLVIVPEPLQALRLIEILGSAATVFCLGYTLKQFGARASFGWALLVVAGTPIALLRMGAFRGAALFTLLWIYFILVVCKPWPRLTFILSWLAVYLYTGFPLLPVTALMFALAAALTQKHLVWKPTVASLLGVGAGLLLNPYWPHHFRFYREDIVDSLVQNGLVPGVNFGAEWSSLSGLDFMRFAALPLLLMAVVGLICAVKGKKLTTEAVYGWLLSGVLLLLSARSIKFLDFALLAVWIAFALSWPTVKSAFAWKNLVLGGLVLLFSIWNLRTARSYLTALPSMQPAVAEYRTLANSLQRETKENECVVVPWDDFPLLFLFNPNNTYPVGLNLNFLRRTDEKRFAAYSYLYSGAFSDPDQALASFFDSKWLVARTHPRNNGEQQLLAMLERYPSIHRVFLNDSFVLFRQQDMPPANREQPAQTAEGSTQSAPSNFQPPPRQFGPPTGNAAPRQGPPPFGNGVPRQGPPPMGDRAPLNGPPPVGNALPPRQGPPPMGDRAPLNGPPTGNAALPIGPPPMGNAATQQQSGR